MIVAVIGISVVVNGVIGANAHAALEWDSATSPSTSDASCSGHSRPVAMAAYPSSSVGFNTNTGRISYSITVKWKKCSGRESTRAYAVTGNPEICPKAGTYGVNYSDAYDCVKYIGDPRYNSSSRLSCRQGTNASCRTDGSRSVFRADNQPSTSQSSKTFSFSRTVPNWGDRKKQSGSYTIGNAGRLCQYYKTGSSYSKNNSGQGCIRLKITVSWKAEFAIRASTDQVPQSYIGTPNFDIEGEVASTGSIANRHNTRLVAYRYNGTQVLSSGSLTARTSSSETPCGVGALRSSSLQFLECRDTQVRKPVADYDGSPNPTSVQRVFRDFNFGVSNGGYTLGTTFCFMLSVKNPTHAASDDNRWYHSAPRCTTNFKRPAVHILGGDVRVRKDIQTSLTAINTPSARAFGSWGEFGVFSVGENRALASGAGLRGGNPSSSQAAWSGLTFANTRPPSNDDVDHDYGYYQGLPQPAAVRDYFASQSGRPINSGTFSLNGRQEGIYKASGNVTVSGVADTSIIIVAEGTVTIAGSGIRYGNISFSSPSQIPQVLIIANAVQINDSVTTVDAWLLADTTLNTCAGRSLTNPGLTAALCNRSLTINGPVAASELYLFRTAGAGTGNNAKSAAETINLRPDAYLWAYNYALDRTRPTTVSLTELPPRY